MANSYNQASDGPLRLTADEQAGQGIPHFVGWNQADGLRVLDDDAPGGQFGAPRQPNRNQNSNHRRLPRHPTGEAPPYLYNVLEPNSKNPHHPHQGNIYNPGPGGMDPEHALSGRPTRLPVKNSPEPVADVADVMDASNRWSREASEPQ